MTKIFVGARAPLGSILGLDLANPELQEGPATRFQSIILGI